MYSYGAHTVTFQARAGRRGVKWCIHNHYETVTSGAVVEGDRRHGKTGNDRGRECDWISERVTGEGRGRKKICEPKRPAVSIGGWSSTLYSSEAAAYAYCNHTVAPEMTD